jgi:very-short-patch-repair endonuclease
MHWGLLTPRRSPVDVTVPGTGGRSRREGIRVHRSTSLKPNAATIRQGLPTTTAARTILDLRRVADRATLEAAVARAEMRHLPIPKLPRLLQEPTRSELERRFLRLCSRYVLPKPDVNVQVGPYEVDFLWRNRRLIVETDGFATHGGRVAFGRDKERDARLRTMGYSVQRFAYPHIVEQAGFVADVVRTLLDGSRPPS